MAFPDLESRWISGARQAKKNSTQIGWLALEGEQCGSSKQFWPLSERVNVQPVFVPDVWSQMKSELGVSLGGKYNPPHQPIAGGLQADTLFSILGGCRLAMHKRTCVLALWLCLLVQPHWKLLSSSSPSH